MRSLQPPDGVGPVRPERTAPLPNEKFEINILEGVLTMKYHEFAGPEPTKRASDERRKRQRKVTVENASLGSVEEPINRLYSDLMRALESTMMNVPATKPRHR
jgi:hypothetical protein